MNLVNIGHWSLVQHDLVVLNPSRQYGLSSSVNADQMVHFSIIKDEYMHMEVCNNVGIITVKPALPLPI